MAAEQEVHEGDYVLLYSEKKKWLLKVSSRQFHTHRGIVDLAEVIGKRYGEKVRSSLSYDFTLLKPTVHDHLLNLVRLTQILYPKDIGLIIQYLDISPGRRVLEIGTGSGALTISIANLVKPSGHLYTYEARKRFAEIAQRNVQRVGLEEYVTVHNIDAKQGIEEREVDAVAIDVGDPWELIPLAAHALKPGYPLCSFSPTINQVEKTVEALHSSHFVDVSTLECFLRDIRVATGKTRPATTMIGHTGYLTFARKALA